MTEKERIRDAAEEYFDHDDWTLQTLEHHNGSTSVEAFHTADTIETAPGSPSVVRRETVMRHPETGNIILNRSLKFAESYVRSLPQEIEVLAEE